MSDISIPGVTSKYNTDKMVEALVKAEAIKLDRMKADQETLKENKKEWQDLNRMMTSLRTTVRGLFSFESPFSERTASSSDPAISPSATREAVEGSTRVQVVQLAQADRFGSKPIAKDTPIPDGNYTFTLGEDTIKLRFRGGTAREFADALSRQGDGKIRASILQNRPDSQILVIESLKTGAKWPLSFKDDALKLGLSLGMIVPDKSGEASFDTKPEKLAAWTKATDSQKGLLVGSEAGLTVKAGGEASLPLPAGFTVSPAMVLEYQVKASSRSLAEWQPPPKPTGPVLAPGPGVSLKDVSLPDLEMPLRLPDWKAPTEPVVVTDNQMLWALNAAKSAEALPPVADSPDFQTVRVPIGTLKPDISALGIRNNNTLRDLQIRNVRIFDPDKRGDYKPANPISVAQDAQIKLEGIDIWRETNVIKDAIPGVTLTLNGTTEKSVPIKVEPDRKLVKEKLIEFVVNYNNVVREINIVSARRDSSDVVTENEFMSDKEQEEALKRLGMFQGDTTLSMIKSRLQIIAANAYRSQDGQAMSLLAQAGISTNASQGGAGVSSAKLRGYLEINEKMLDKAMAEHFLALKDLFGMDSNGDLLPDSGAGVELDNYLLSYVQIGGILASKTSAIDTQIKAKETDIKNYQAHLKTFEADLKLKYGKMEAAVNKMQQSGKSLESMNNNNN